jgi:hypothetical protein
MSNDITENNDIIGLSSFLDFFCAVLSRIAYTEDPMPLYLVSGLFRIFPKDLIRKLSKVINLKDFEKDDIIFGLNKKSEFPIREHNGKKYIDFMPYVKDINILIEDPMNSPYYSTRTDPNIKIISIADSNYGDIIVIGVQYLPNLVFAAYRGTYSSKTAGSYIQLESLTPLPLDDKGAMVLKGIAKITFDVIHTVTDALEYIAKTFLHSSNKPIPVFTGHSLGGAMATIMGFEYCNNIITVDKTTSNYLNKKSICVSFGAPRVLGENTSEQLCKYVVNGSTLVHRFSNSGDPVTSMPPPGLGFYHPCSSAADKRMDHRKLVTRECDSSIKISPIFRSEYSKPIHCTNEAVVSMGVPIWTDHSSYLYVSFVKGTDLAHVFIHSAFTRHTKEIQRIHRDNMKFNLKIGDSVLRIIQMTGNNGTGKFELDCVDLVKLREKDALIHNEDSRDSLNLFECLIHLQKKVPVKFTRGRIPVPFVKTFTNNQLVDFNHTYEAALKNSKPVLFNVKSVKSVKSVKRRRGIHKRTRRLT